MKEPERLLVRLHQLDCHVVSRSSVVPPVLQRRPIKESSLDWTVRDEGRQQQEGRFEVIASQVEPCDSEVGKGEGDETGGMVGPGRGRVNDLEALEGIGEARDECTEGGECHRSVAEIVAVEGSEGALPIRGCSRIQYGRVVEAEYGQISV